MHCLHTYSSYKIESPWTIQFYISEHVGTYIFYLTYLYNESLVTKTWRNSYLTHEVSTGYKVLYTMIHPLNSTLNGTLAYPQYQTFSLCGTIKHAHVIEEKGVSVKYKLSL